MRLSFILFLCLVAEPVLAQSVGAPPPADIISRDVASVEAGLSCAFPVDGKTDAPGTVAGSVNVVRDPAGFMTKGRVVPAVLGFEFGVRARLADPMRSQVVTIVVTHPPIGPEGITKETWDTTLDGMESLLNSYRFEKTSELVTGRWAISAVAGSQTLYRVAYDVVDPASVPDLAQLCDAPEVQS